MLFHHAAEEFLRKTRGSCATYEEIIEVAKIFAELRPVASENYRSLLLRKGEPRELTVTAFNGEAVAF